MVLSRSFRCGGNVLSAEVLRLLGYWQSLGGGERVPERSELDLRKLTTILPWMFILEMAEDGCLRYRLSGSALEEAVGRGMAGRTYAEIFSDHEQAAIMEELYAVALVQSCGVLRTGSLSFDEDERFAMEVLALPFIETRAMGGTVFVGVVRPFAVDNLEFVDRWGGFKHDLSEILLVPSPRVVQEGQFSQRVRDALSRMHIQVRALDIEKLLEIDRKGGVPGLMGLPALDLRNLSDSQRQSLN